MSFMSKMKAVFIDRDGTIIYDVGYPKEPDQVEILPEVCTALSSLKDQGFKLIIVSNQSGIGRGILTLEEVELVHQRLISVLGKRGISIDATYYCPHAPEENCICRKPSPEMFFWAAKDLNVDLTNSFMIGDKISDIEAGKKAGCKTILLNSGTLGKCDTAPDFVANDWAAVSSYILNH